jgi:hypothetical protein
MVPFLFPIAYTVYPAFDKRVTAVNEYRSGLGLAPRTMAVFMMQKWGKMSFMGLKTISNSLLNVGKSIGKALFHPSIALKGLSCLIFALWSKLRF